MSSGVPIVQSALNERLPSPVEFQTVVLSEGGRALDQLLRDRFDASEMSALELPLEPDVRSQHVELPMPRYLDEESLRALNNSLPSMPPLHYPISDADRAAFLDAWSGAQGVASMGAHSGDCGLHRAMQEGTSGDCGG